jgi:hypothetical protein
MPCTQGSIGSLFASVLSINTPSQPFLSPPCGQAKKTLTKRCLKIQRIFGILENLLIFDGKCFAEMPACSGPLFGRAFWRRNEVEPRKTRENRGFSVS